MKKAVKEKKEQKTDGINRKQRNEKSKLNISTIKLNVSSLNTVIKKAETARLDNKARYNYV